MVTGVMRKVGRRLTHGKALSGYFDGFTGAAFTGWAMAIDGAPAQVSLYFGEHLVAVTASNIARDDLRGLRLAFGFSFPVNYVEPVLSKINDTEMHVFRVKTAKGLLSGSTGLVSARQFSESAAVICAVSRHGAAISTEDYVSDEIY